MCVWHLNKRLNCPCYTLLAHTPHFSACILCHSTAHVCVRERPSPFPAAPLMLGPPPGSHYGCICVCICGSGWSSPVFFLLIVLYCSALAVPEGNGGLGGGRWGKAAGVAEGVLVALVRRADDRPNKASQGLGPSLSALPPRCPLCSLLPPRFATPSHSPPQRTHVVRP